ncbi:DUF421 domain-containing protein [Paenibacillus sp. N4]|uniref:DUF421 domain-containing protein n=1 Tax=Paenibacillus vietnamensis TaxID=2590547 RepID=UPI001CD08CE5|nr:DUF421 domain-containing protein [Paenibacillus vietnamensis]MCA0757774.1 DUF421 domain-containing protein [Paenibacillus vietnamensis]
MPDWLEIIVRTLAAITILFILTKVLGKRQISQLSLFEYITGISIGNIAAYVSLDLDNLWYLGIVSLAVWVSISVGMEFLTMRSKRVRDIVDGNATVLIENGKLDKQKLFKERLTVDELLEQLRKKDVFRMADVEFAVMEPSGEINVMLKKEHKPITPELLGWKVGKEHVAQTVIMDGEIEADALEKTDCSKEQLLHELKRKNVRLQDVFVGQIDGNGRLSVQTGDLRQYPESKAHPKPRDRVAMLTEQFEAELIRLGGLARNESDRRVYESALERFQAGMGHLQDQLQE